MRLALAYLSVLLIGLVPASLNAEDNYNMPAIAAQSNDLYHSSSPTFGNPNADVTIVEFYDYQCGYCKASEEGLERLLQEDKNLRIIYKDFPKLGPLSDTAAIATLAGLRQGANKYWQLHTTLMQKDFHLSDYETLYQTAASVGMNIDQLQQDMGDPAIVQQIQTNIALGRSVGVQMTPTFIIGGRLLPGYADYDKLKKMVAYVRATDQGR